MRPFPLILSGVFALLLGSGPLKSLAQNEAVENLPPAAYVIVGGLRVLKPDQLNSYVEAAMPLAEKAGLDFLASSDAPKLLEGKWETQGMVLIESYRSKKEFLDFWNSKQYQAAKKLREEAIAVDYILLIEGLPGVVPPGQTDDKEAFLFVGGAKLLNQKPNALQSYGQAAAAPAKAFGLRALARTKEPVVLEGHWPHEGEVILDAFPSMQKLTGFWYSEAYQKAIKLRQGIAEIDFIIALEGNDATPQ